MDINDRNIWRQVFRNKAIANLNCLLEFYLSTEKDEYERVEEVIDNFIKWLNEEGLG